MILPTWVKNLEESSSYEEVQLKMFYPVVQTSDHLAKIIN